MKAIAALVLIGCASSLAFAQADDPAPKYLAASIRAAKSPFAFGQPMPPRNGRHEMRNVSLVDLIRWAYNLTPDKILGGPSWLEMDRFDIAVKVPPDITWDVMLRALLADRFKLVVHQENKPLPTYALVVAKKLQLKQSTGSEDAGCQRESTGSGDLGDGSIHYRCQNMTMPALVSNLSSMIGGNFSSNPVIDDTKLEGRWNFDLQYSLGWDGETGHYATIFDAVEKLGLKLEERQVPTPVLVVDGANEPNTDPPGTAEILPPIPPPTEFDAASVKPSDPVAHELKRQMYGNRLSLPNTSLHSLVLMAFNVPSRDSVVGTPSWADSERFDIDVKAPDGVVMTPFDSETLAPMMLSLLKDRFKLTYHAENRTITAYNLAATKPKMKKADPSSRTFCKGIPRPAGSPPGVQALRCQNITMAQFADRLHSMTTDLIWPVEDATEISGGWDFEFACSFSTAAPTGTAAGRGGAEGGAPAASDPGGSLPVFEAVEKELGLRLEKVKREVPVIAIDHLEQKPTEN